MRCAILKGLVSTIQKNAPLHQIAFLTWALAGSTCIYVWSLKLLSDCNAVCRSILPAINKYAHVRSLTFLGLQWIEFESFKGCKFWRNKVGNPHSSSFKEQNSHGFCTKNPLTLGQKQLTAEENQSQISKCLQSRAPVQQQHAVALAADMK